MVQLNVIKMKLSGVGVFNNKKADLAFKLLLFKDLTKVLITEENRLVPTQNKILPKINLFMG